MRSLQSLSLDVIVKNFKLFHLAFTTSKDARMQQNMDFLQRRFSDFLAENLLYDNKDLYFEFVINKHLTSVDFFWYNCRQVKSIDDFFRRLPNLTTIRFRHCGDEVLKSIAEFCPRIVEIDAGYSKVTNQGIKYLCETKNGMPPCPELKRIVNLGKSSITDKEAELLIQSVPSIEQLDYPDVPHVLHSIHTKNLSQHQKGFFCNITKINFKECKKVRHFTEVFKACVTVCPNLEELFCELSKKEEFDALANSHLRLKKLYLWFTQGSLHIDIDNYLKASGRNLTLLSICNCTTSLSVLEEHCPVLHDLVVSDVDFTDGDDRQPIFPSLTNFDFAIRQPDAVKTVGLLPLLSPKVEHVRMSCLTLSDEMKNKILLWFRNPAAKTIAFLESALEIGFLRECLLNSPSLTCMALFLCSYDVDNPKEILEVIAENLPNKPKILKA